MIYLIYGETGEYGDHTEWDYGYTTSEQKAQEMTQFLNSKLLELGLQGKYIADLWEKQRENRQLFEDTYDSNFRLDYTGSYYRYRSIAEIE